MTNKSVTEMITGFEEDNERIGIELLKLKSRSRNKLTHENCYQFLLSLAFLDTKKESNRVRLINALVKKVYIVKGKNQDHLPFDRRHGEPQLQRRDGQSLRTGKL